MFYNTITCPSGRRLEAKAFVAMSFADFAANTPMPSVSKFNRSISSNSQNNNNTLILDKLSLKLEQYQRQVGAVRRQSQSVLSGSTMEQEQDLEDRIKFACLLQEEIAKLLPQLPRSTAMEVSRRKLLKDFDAISNQLEKAVQEIANAQMLRSDLLNQEAQRADNDGSLQAMVNGQVIEFKQLENEIAHNEALIEERSRDIDRIHQSVAQVNEIFRDLAVIVADQQSAIDNTAGHIEESLAQTQQGLSEVKKAAANQSSCVIM
jgi:hypothetical protein